LSSKHNPKFLPSSANHVQESDETANVNFLYDDIVHH